MVMNAQRLEKLSLESEKKGEEDDEYECHVCSANLYLSLVGHLAIPISHWWVCSNLYTFIGGSVTISSSHWVVHVAISTLSLVGHLYLSSVHFVEIF
jgi:hypothetical protein